MKSIPVIKILLILLLTISVAIGADEDTGNWIGSFSSEDYEDFLEPVEKEKIYYYWQMEKLKRRWFLDTFVTLIPPYLWKPENFSIVGFCSLLKELKTRRFLYAETFLFGDVSL
ncbi:hypothetical protein LEP1GSC137_4360 [Leptospira borgpetersenii str. Noumea 25]|nr:hypothetical protein LEP1GSC137_4360 [Leptospira borgpetersenii str. Noumea 25]